MTGPAINAHQLQCGQSRRRVRLTGRVGAIVEYSLTPLFPSVGIVRVDGQVVRCTHGERWLGLYHEFWLLSDEGWVAARIDASVPLGLLIRLAISVEDEVVYADQDYGRTITVGLLNDPLESLPIPASAARDRLDGLPMPGGEPRPGS